MQSQTPPHKSSFREYLLIAAFTFFCFLAFTYHLDAVPPYHSDENFYVTSTRNMIDSGDYLTPVYHDKKRFAKPILFYWMVAASYKTFGIHLFSARLVSAFFGALCIPLTWLTARRLFGRREAMLSALILPGCYLHFQISRWAITDMAMNFFILLAIYFFIRGMQEESDRAGPFYIAYACMGMGFMIKGPPAVLVPGLAVGGFLLILREKKLFSRLRLARGSVIVTAIVVPWFAAMLALHGDAFKNHILGPEIRDRMVHDTPFSLYYLAVTLRYYLPWSLFFLAALAVRFGLATLSPAETPGTKGYFRSLAGTMKTRFRELGEKDHQPILFCLTWLIGPLLLFTLFRIEHSRYMLPASPALAMITAQFLVLLTDSPHGWRRKPFKIPFYLTLMIYFLCATGIATATLMINPVYSVPFPLMLLPMVFLFGAGFLLLFFWFQKIKALVIALSVIQILTLAFLSGDALPFFNRYPMKAFAEEILADPDPEKVIGLYRLGNHRARMGVRTGLPSIYLSNPDELKQFIQSGKKVFVVLRESDWKEDLSGLSLTLQATDTGWKKVHLDQKRIRQIMADGLQQHLDEYTETYVLLKTGK